MVHHVGLSIQDHDRVTGHAVMDDGTCTEHIQESINHTSHTYQMERQGLNTSGLQLLHALQQAVQHSIQQLTHAEPDHHRMLPATLT